MIYIYLFLGILTYLFTDMATFKRGLPTDVSVKDAVSQYLGLNFFHILGGIGAALTLTMLSENGQLKALEQLGFTFGQQGGKELSAVVFGWANQWIAIKLRKFTKSIVLQTDQMGDVKLRDN